MDKYNVFLMLQLFHYWSLEEEEKVFDFRLSAVKFDQEIAFLTF